MEDATTQQCANFKPEWLKEAIAELDHYKTNPFTTYFMKKYGLPVLPVKKAMLGLIQLKITKSKKSKKPPHFEDLVEYVDELKPWGKQSVSLYTLRYDEKEYLKKLLDPDYIKECLSKLEDRYNNNICRWKSDTPFLSEVRHNFDYQNKRGWLSYKWIQTRQFLDFVGPVLTTFEERSVNFFIIDLADGSAQLRIQNLPVRSLTTIEAELQTYTKEIEKLLDFHRFSPISLQPVMRESLLKKVLPITYWSVRTQQGNLIGARVNPSFVQRRLTLPFQGIRPREVTVYWGCEQIVKKSGRLYFALEADDNVIVFNAITDKLRVDYLVSNLLEAARLHSKDKEIKKIINVREIIGPPPPPPGILQGGFRDWIKRRVTGTTRENIKKIAVESAVLPGLVIIRVIFEWLKETLIEKITNIPFIVFELLVYAILLLVFYGGDRFRKYFFKIPPKYAIVAIKILTGESVELIINNREFDRWKKAKLYSAQNVPPLNSINPD